MIRVERPQLDPARRLPGKLLGHHLARGRAHDNTVAAADRRGRRNDDDVAVAEHRLHGVAADLQGVGVRIADLRQADLVPAPPDRIAAVVEEAGGAGLCEAEQGDDARRRRGPRNDPGAFDQAAEIQDVRVGGVEHLGEAFGSGPAGLAVGSAAFRRIEGRGIQPRPARQPRGRQATLRGKRVEGSPDVIMIHRASCLPAGSRARCARRRQGNMQAPLFHR